MAIFSRFNLVIRGTVTTWSNNYSAWAPKLQQAILQPRLQKLVLLNNMSTSSSVAVEHGSSIPEGVWPTMITPFRNDKEKSVDWEALDMLTDWYINSGCTGLFSVCLSSEMFQLSNDERVEIAKRVSSRAAGRVPVITGATFEGGVEEQAALMKEIGRHVNAVVVITNQICGMEESDEVWLSQLKKLMELTGDLPLGLYETPIPAVRSLTPEMLAWCAGTGRFLFHKDTSLNRDIMLRKLEAVKAVPGSTLKFFTAKIQFYKTLLDHGGSGFSGVTPNFFPWLVVWAHRHRDSAEEPLRLRVHNFLSVADRVFAHKYPNSSKHYLSKFYGAHIHPVCRTPSLTINDQDAMGIEAMHQMMLEFCREIGVTPIGPVTTPT